MDRLHAFAKSSALFPPTYVSAYAAAVMLEALPPPGAEADKKVVSNDDGAILGLFDSTGNLM